jgi:DNA-binding FrmR family transcriptional regulator
MDDETTTKILNRLKSIAGHVRGIEKMVAGDEYCVDIVNQILAVQRALHKVNGMVLERHMHTCVTKALRSDNPEERERVIGEILAAFETSGRV